MRFRIRRPHPFRGTVIRAIRNPDIPLAALWRAFRSLPDEDRDCLPWVQRLLSLEQ